MSLGYVKGGKDALIVVLLVTTEAAFQGVSYASDKSTRRWLWTWWYHGIPCEGVCVCVCGWTCMCVCVCICACAVFIVQSWVFHMLVYVALKI